MRAVLVIALLATVAALGGLKPGHNGGKKATTTTRKGPPMTLGPRNYKDIPTDFLAKFDEIARSKLDHKDLTPEARTAGRRIQQIFQTKERKAAYEQVWVFVTGLHSDIRTALYNLNNPLQRG